MMRPMFSRLRIVSVLPLIAFVSCRAVDDNTVPAIGLRGMVSSAHPEATEAGLEILRAGGNAFDAAVAVAAALNVTEPMMSGMGGYGTILVYSVKEKRVRFLDSSGRIPKSVNSDVYRAPTPGHLQNRRGAKAVSTPGNVKAWEAMSRGYGSLPWRRLFVPAIRLAEEGFVVDRRIAGLIARAYESFPAHAREIYGEGGRPVVAGQELVQRDLAASLRLVAAEGAAALYGGRFGIAVHNAMREGGGFLAMADLQAHQAEWWDPIHIDYRGFDVYVPSPPANSFPALVRMGLMSCYGKGAVEHNSALYLHRYAEVTKHGFWTRLRWAGDPEVAPPPLDRLLSPDYWREQVRRIDDAAARPFVPPREFGKSGENTTHFVVADKFGNVVSATQTLGNSFGSRIMPKGTGIWLNNSLAYCTFEPKGNPMDAYPGRRKLSGDVPAIVMRDGKPWIAVGTPGGHTIPQTVPQIIMNVLDFDMNIQGAVSAPRISFVEPDHLAVERTIPAVVRRALAEKGHQIRTTRALGNAHALMIHYGKDGKPRDFFGAADPRGAGLAKGY